MAWMASHLFLRCADHDAVVQVTTSLLVGKHRRSLKGVSDPPGPVVVTPPCDGWTAVVGVGAWIDDLPWAGARLSSLGHAVSGEIFGNTYCLRLIEYRDDSALRAATGQRRPRTHRSLA